MPRSDVGVEVGRLHASMSMSMYIGRHEVAFAGSTRSLKACSTRTVELKVAATYQQGRICSKDLTCGMHDAAVQPQSLQPVIVHAGAATSLTK